MTTMEKAGSSARMRDVRRILNEGGHVQFNWRTCKTILISVDEKSFTTIDGPTYQGFLRTLASMLERTEKGSTETKDLVIEWRKGV